MGFIKKAAEKAAEEVVNDVGAVAAVGAIELIGATVKAVGKAGTAAVDTVGKVIDKRNTAGLKKESKKVDYCLFVNRETKIGKGIYRVTDKNKEEKYNTLIEGNINENFIIRLYSKSRGQIANISKTVMVEKKLFFADKYSTLFILHSDVYSSGVIIESDEGGQREYSTDFNDWRIMGDFSKRNYKIFDFVSGETVASITKKFRSASTYKIECEDNQYESVIVLISILLDIIE